MKTTFTTTIAIAILCLAIPASAEPRVELELAMEREFSATQSHEALEAVGRVGFDTVRARAERGDERPSVEKRGTMAAVRFMVVGILNGRGELELPGGTYSYRDREGLARWLSELKRGAEARGEEKTAFGLSKAQFEAVEIDLKTGVTFETKGLDADDAVAAISRSLRGPLAISDAAGRALRADKVRDELKGLTSGTALAAILRPAGCYFKPVVSNGTISYTVDVAAADSEPWPIGWSAKKDTNKLIPKAYDWTTIELEDVSVVEVVVALCERLKIPFLYDHNSLAIARIDPTKIKYNLPSKRTYYYRVLTDVLSKAKLQGEFRIDERGEPLLWITTIAK